jgi:hypothetical protein
MLVFVALIGAGLTLGALHAPSLARATATQAAAEPAP